MPHKTSGTQAPCLVPACGRPVTRGVKDGAARGLCPQCYADARRVVRLNRTTWAELELYGLVRPPLRVMKPQLTRVEFALAAVKARPAVPAAPVMGGAGEGI